MSRAFGGSRASWVSAIARKCTPCCFLLHTAFQQHGGWVRGAELRPGIMLCGSDMREVHVLHVVRHPRQERDIVRLRTMETYATAFAITADHWLIVRSPEGQQVECQARDVVDRWKARLRPALYNGACFLEVCDASIEQWQTEVIEVWFPDGAAVLARILPRRRSRGHSHDVGGIACYGKLHGASRLAVRGPRSRSEPVHYRLKHRAAHVLRLCRSSDKGASESYGTERHDDANPHHCFICWVHHRHLCMPDRFPPCSDRERCMKCHSPHPEFDLRGRRRKFADGTQVPTLELLPGFHPAARPSPPAF